MSTHTTQPTGRVPAAAMEGHAAAEAPTPRRRTRTILIAFGVVALIVAFAAWLYYRNRADTDDAEIAAHIESIAPRVSGTVVEVDVNDDQLVQAGQVLFRLDDRDYRAALQQAQANLQAAEASAAGARSNVPITQTSSGSHLTVTQAAVLGAQSQQQLAEHNRDEAAARLRAAQASLVQAQANAADAESNRQRYAQLVAKNEVSQQQYDDVATQAAAMAAGVTAAQDEVNAAQQAVASATAQVEVAAHAVQQAEAAERGADVVSQQTAVSRANAATAAARVAQAAAEVAQAELNLSYCVVDAPTAGEVGNKNIEIGDRFQPGQVALNIVNLSDLWVWADYKETQLDQMRAGQRATVHVDAYNQDLRAEVNSIGAATGAQFSLLPPENATGNYVKVVQRVPVKLVFTPGQDLHRLRPGMSVETTVFTK